ncbi:MAG TPA: glycosyltransferase family 9 protein [Ignavibacteria bacterium]|nr:glycosyltransferase family 9 protein [Ignavibacteria bacterium]
MKILINALSGNGDALMYSPCINLLKKKMPDCEIHLLAMFKSVEEMFETNPYIDKIFFIDFLHQGKIKSFREVSNLRKNNYDYTINIYPSNRLEYNGLNRLLGKNKRLGMHYLHTNIFRGEFLNTDLADEIQDIHNVMQNVNLTRKIIDIRDDEIGGLEIFFTPEMEQENEKWLKEINPENKKLVGLHCGSSTLKNHINKRWDKYKYVMLARELTKNKNVKVLLFGNELSLNNDINKMADGVCTLASTQNYMDSMVRMSKCSLFVSNDTAFMHSSAAFKIPVVCIFGYTNYKELYPWQSPHIIIRRELECSPCFYNSPRPVKCIWNGHKEFQCIRQISFEEVYEACEKLLDTNS